MSPLRAVVMGPESCRVGNGVEIVLDRQVLRGGLASFLWASSRSMASLHPRAALIRRHLTGAAVTDGMRLLLAGSLIQFLFERYGMAPLRRFFDELEGAGLDGAARRAFGKTFPEMAEDWEAMLQAMES